MNFKCEEGSLKELNKLQHLKLIELPARNKKTESKHIVTANIHVDQALH